MDPQRPNATAFAVRDGKLIVVGNEAEVGRVRDEKTRMLDARGHTVILGLNDPHAHAIRGGRFYKLDSRRKTYSAEATVTPNPSIERTCSDKLRLSTHAAHVQRWASRRLLRDSE